MYVCIIIEHLKGKLKNGQWSSTNEDATIENVAEYIAIVSGKQDWLRMCWLGTQKENKLKVYFLLWSVVNFAVVESFKNMVNLSGVVNKIEIHQSTVIWNGIVLAF